MGLISIIRREEHYQFSFEAHYAQSIDYLIESTKYVHDQFTSSHYDKFNERVPYIS